MAAEAVERTLIERLRQRCAVALEVVAHLHDANLPGRSGENVEARRHHVGAQRAHQGVVRQQAHGGLHQRVQKLVHMVAERQRALRVDGADHALQGLARLRVGPGGKGRHPRQQIAVEPLHRHLEEVEQMGQRLFVVRLGARLFGAGQRIGHSERQALYAAAQQRLIFGQPAPFGQGLGHALCADGGRRCHVFSQVFCKGTQFFAKTKYNG